jgi:hypothetical protein
MEVKRGKTQGNATVSEHAKAFRKLKGLPEPENDIQFTELPLSYEALGEYLLSTYWQLSEGRTSNGFGPNPLTWVDLKAWSELANLHLRPADVYLLRAMDTALLKEHAHG